MGKLWNFAIYCDRQLTNQQVNLYPRLSIDNSRRVRELSHLVFCELCKSTKKRIQKHLPKVAGAWLAGQYDKDRAASKVAKTTLAAILDTEKKVVSLKKQCQAAILEYAQDAIKETPETLSDERTMSKDDREDKHRRVVSSSLYLVVNLLTSLDKDEILKEQEKYEELLLNNQEVWSLAASEDAYVRKSANELLVACIEHQPAIVQESLELIGQNFIIKGLRTSQSTTASSLLSTLVSLSSKYPQVWTYAYGKKDVLSLLRSFMQRGSQSCNEQYWGVLFQLLELLPRTILIADIKSSEFM